MKPANPKLIAGLCAMSTALLSTSAGFAAEGGEAGGGSWGALILYAINTAIFVAILLYYAGPPIRRLFADRAHQVRDRRARARTTLAEAEAAAREAISRLEHLAEEKARLLKDLEAETAYLLKQVRDAANEGSTRIVRDAEMTVAAAADDARRRMRAHLARVAGVVARELAGGGFNADDQRRMLDSFAEKLATEARP